MKTEKRKALPSSFLRFLGFSLLFYGCSIIMILYENPEKQGRSSGSTCKMIM